MSGRGPERQIGLDSQADPGAGGLLAGATLLLAGWLVPLSVNLLVDLLSQSGLQAMEPATAPGLGEIMARVMSWGCLAASAVSLAATLAERSPLRSRWWLVGVPAIYAGLIASLHLALGTSFLEFRDADAGPSGTLPALALLTTALLIMAAAMRYGRGAGGGTSDTAAPRPS